MSTSQTSDAGLTRRERRRQRELDAALTTADLWAMMERRVPPVVSEYFRGGADAETTLRANVRAFQQATTTARGARRFEALDLSTTAAGHDLAVPYLLAPVGSLRALWPRADVHAAAVAAEHGTLKALSTLSGTPMEEVAEAAHAHGGDAWFQLYLVGGRDTALRGIERAKAAGFSALMLTIDTGVAGNRAAHARMRPMDAARPFAGLGLADRAKLAVRKLALAPQMATRPGWVLGHFRDGGLMEFVNVRDADGAPMPYADIATQLAESAVTWDDVRWVREAWDDDRPLVVKGVHSADDARRAEDAGASAVVWSNHGGRQQDRVPPTLHIVADEMPRVGETQLDFLMDGGVRNGTDVLIALTYGVKAVGLGRVAVAGLGAGGPAGLRRALDIVRGELERAMRLVGVESVAEVRERGAELRRESRLLGDGHLPPVVF